MTAERTDDDLAGDSGAGGRAPGQRSGSRRRASDRTAGPHSGADLPDTPATELPPVSPETTMTNVPTTLPTAGSPMTPAGDVASGHPIESPTAELRGPSPRAEQPRVAPIPTNIYRSRRPGVAILLVLPTVGVGLALVRALAIAAFGDTYDIAGIVGSICGLASLPFLFAGIYGLVTGAAHGAEHYGFRIWARPPLAYLIVGLVFVVASTLALS